jgi:hypothetical protein
VRGRGSGGKPGIADVPVVVLLLAAAAFATPQEAGKGRDSMSRFHDAAGAVRPTLPDIDRRIPARTETATFALG